MRGLVFTCALASGVFGAFAPGLLADQQVPAAERKLEIAFDMNGRVTLVAENVTLREILAEWGRVGGSSMINGDRLAGATIPAMRFDNRPEREVLDSLLRSAAGYILGPRTVRTSGPSLYEAVMILPTSSPVASSGYAGAVPPAAPFRTPGAPEDEIPPVVPAVGVPAPEQSPPRPAGAPAPPRNTNPGVYVPIVPVQPVGTATPPTGRGRGGGGGL
jgi:hypothetical protein